MARSAQLDRESSEPLWVQLSDVLKSWMDSGEFVADQALPSEAEMVARFGVSRTVVREALADLARNGRIYKIRAKGSFVSPVTSELRFIGSSSGSAFDLDASDRRITTRVLSQFVTPANDVQAKHLKLQPGEDVVFIRRLRLVDASPWLLVSAALPHKMFPQLERARLEDRSLYEYLRRHYGVESVGADRWLQAVLPDEDQASLLDLRAGEPVLKDRVGGLGCRRIAVRVLPRTA